MARRGTLDHFDARTFFMVQQKAGQHEAGLLLVKKFASIAYLPATR